MPKHIAGYCPICEYTATLTLARGTYLHRVCGYRLPRTFGIYTI